MLKINQIIDTVLAEPLVIAALQEDQEFKGQPVSVLRDTALQTIADLVEEDPAKAARMVATIEAIANAFFRAGQNAR